MNVTIRLAKINTKELKGPEPEAALKAKERLHELIYGEEIFLETIRAKRATTKQQTIQDPHGRYLGVIYHKGININQKMLTEGYAEPYIHQ
jgi:endonuclease YncB( thermonuclease family)